MELLLAIFCPHIITKINLLIIREPFKGFQCTIGKIYCCGGEYIVQEKSIFEKNLIIFICVILYLSFISFIFLECHYILEKEKEIEEEKEWHLARHFSINR